MVQVFVFPKMKTDNQNHRSKFKKTKVGTLGRLKPEQAKEIAPLLSNLPDDVKRNANIVVYHLHSAPNEVMESTIALLKYLASTKVKNDIFQKKKIPLIKKKNND